MWSSPTAAKGGGGSDFDVDSNWPLTRHKGINARAESIFGALKAERIDGERYFTRRHRNGVDR